MVTYDQHEASVIGACIMDNQAFWKVTGTLRAGDFASAFLADVWRAIEEMANRGDSFDVVSLSEGFPLPLADLARLTMDTPGSANVKAYANIVRDRSIVRDATAEIERARARLAVGDKTAIPDLQLRLESLHRTEKPSTTFNEALRTGLDEVEQAQIRAAEGGGIVGAPTGMRIIDNRTGGLSGGKLIILAARPSLGKTALALQAAQCAARAGFPVGMMSLEMGSGEIAIRAFAHQYGVNNSALAAGDRDVVAKLTQKLSDDPVEMATVRSLPIYIDEDTFTLGGIVARISEWSRLHGIKMVVIDHLQLVEIEKGMSRNDGLGEITRQLKILAKRLDIPVVLLCQLNREVERQQRKPRLADLRDSGNIEQDADMVIALHGDLETNQFGGRNVEIGFLKLRGGLVGWGGEMNFNGQTQTFSTIEYQYGPE